MTVQQLVLGWFLVLGVVAIGHLTDLLTQGMDAYAGWAPGPVELFLLAQPLLVGAAMVLVLASRRAGLVLGVTGVLAEAVAHWGFYREPAAYPTVGAPTLTVLSLVLVFLAANLWGRLTGATARPGTVR